MRWSWSSFVSGVTAGAIVVALLWLAMGEPLDAPLDRVAEADLDGMAEDGSAATTETFDLPGRDAGDETTGAENVEGVRPGRRPRTHVTPEPGGVVAGGVGSGGGTPVASGTILDSSGFQVAADQIQVVSRDGRGMTLRMSSGSSLELINLYRRGMTRSSRYVAPQALERARAAAAASGSAGGESAARLLDSDGYEPREMGLGLALAAEPPRVDLLLDAVDDAEYPALRGAALLAAFEAAPSDPAVIAAVLRSARAGDPDLRQAAIGLFPDIGEPAADLALEMLRTGDYVEDVLEPLAETVATTGRAGDLLGSQPPPAAALRVVREMLILDDPQIVASIPNLLRPLLVTSEVIAVAPEIFGALSPLYPGFLRDVVTSSSLAQGVRLAALKALLQGEGLRAEGVQAATAVISDFRAPVPLVRAVIGRLSSEDLDEGAAAGALWTAAESHPSAWVRDDALAKLRAAGRTGYYVLEIHSATYGKGSHTIDVTEAVRSRVSGGALRFQVGNDLGGDPISGTVKELRVEYTLRVKRLVRVVNEFETLVLP